MERTLSNELLTVTASSLGAELQSIRNNLTGHEYLWQGDPCYWKRRSPILFPIVGAVWDGTFRMDGREFRMGQHGFARDMNFETVADSPEGEMWFSLKSDDETLAKYPRKFRLAVGYELYHERITVRWRLRNDDEKDMNFQIGAHPAFNLPRFNSREKVHGYLEFDRHKFTSQVIASKGCVGDAVREYDLPEAILPITADTFKNDAVIVGGQFMGLTSILTTDRLPYLTVSFYSPYVGYWAPSADAPFVCIEPWYGRADSVGYNGDFRGKEAVQHLAPGQEFHAYYQIIIDDV